MVAVEVSRVDLIVSVYIILFSHGAMSSDCNVSFDLRMKEFLFFEHLSFGPSLDQSVPEESTNIVFLAADRKKKSTMYRRTKISTVGLTQIIVTVFIFYSQQVQSFLPVAVPRNANRNQTKGEETRRSILGSFGPAK